MVFINQIFGDRLTTSNFLKFCMAYPFIIRAMYLIRQYWEPGYMNSTCLMDLVRISAPDHFEIHPVWHHFQKMNNETCEGITGKPIDEYFLDMYAQGKTEFYIVYGIFISYAILALFRFLSMLGKGQVKSVIAVIAAAILAWHQGSLFFILTHYQNDITHINGNVMHHSNYEVEGDNASAVKTMPPGLVFSFPLNFLVVEMLFYVIFDYWKLDKKLYFSLSPWVCLSKLVLQMKVIHPYVHAYHKSWYKATFGEWFPINDYAHVTCHHYNGYCLGDGPAYFGWWYDTMLYLHAKIYSQDLISFKSLQHYILNFAVDYVLILLTFVLSFLAIAVLSPILQKSQVTSENQKPGKKVQ